MKNRKTAVIVLACMAATLWMALPKLLAQEPDIQDIPDFQWNLPGETQDFLQEEFPESDETSESSFIEEAPPALRPKPKKMVETPDPPVVGPINAGDFRDPFFPVRGFNPDAKKVLEPGITIDGVQFHSYGESEKFIENYYRDSRFSVTDVYGEVFHHEGGEGCLTCHRGIEEISTHHRFSCTKCHGGRQKSNTLPAAHKGLVSNPSSLENAQKFCGKCHKSQVEKMLQSTMTTAKGIINTTRYAWGAQGPGATHSLNPDPALKEKPLPGIKTGHLVDQFLRTNCLRCHLGGEAPHRAGDYRASGCAACHMLYNNDGIGLTHDRAIQSVQRKDSTDQGNPFQRKRASQAMNSRRGYPVLHKFTVAVPSVQCEHCHNNNGVGNEFEGLFGKPPRSKTARQDIDANEPVLYGREHEFLVPDIHRERGMHCIDCHGQNELKASASSALGHSNIEIRCQDCHGTQEDPPNEYLLVESDPNVKNILKSNKLNANLKKKIKVGDSLLVTSKGTPLPNTKHAGDQWILYSKVTGKKHIIPILKKIAPPLAHQVSGHMQSMECHACHARWSAAEWGLHAILEPSPDKTKWQDWSFPDPSIQKFLASEKPDAGKMIDWLTAKPGTQGIEGEWLEGTWWPLFTETGWNDMVLGKNSRDKYTIMKPRYQFFITDLSATEKSTGQRAAIPITQDGKPGLILRPHAPHTIRKTVRTCENCHESALTAGLGDPTRESIHQGASFLDALKKDNTVLPEFQLKQMVTPSGASLQTAFPQGETRFLNEQELSKLDSKTNSYRAYRYLDLKSLNLPRLLMRSEFPVDSKHRAKEKSYGPPQPVEDMYYDLDQRKFFSQTPQGEDPDNDNQP
jgi:hypothetical protein